MRLYLSRLMVALSVVLHVASTASAAPAPAASPASADGKAPLRVVVAGESPFVEEVDGRIDGLSVRIWAALASETEKTYTMYRAVDVEAAVGEVASGKADVVVGPVSITSERARRLTFTLSYYTSTLCIATRPQEHLAWGRLLGVVWDFATFSAVVFVLLFVVGNLVWFLERKQNSQTFPVRYRDGVGNGMWLAIVTMTGVGYGDTVPVTRAGRLLTAAWMLVGMLFVSSLTGGIASLLTELRLVRSGVTSPRELAGRIVAVPLGTVASQYVNSIGATALPVPDLKAAFTRLENKQADAVVFSGPQMRDCLHKNPQYSALVTPVEGVRVDYGFGVRRGLSLGERFDVALLHLKESGGLDRLEDLWIHGPRSTSPNETGVSR